MLKHFYHRTSVITRLQQGPLGPYLEDLALTLHQQGYAPSTIREGLDHGIGHLPP